MNPITEYVLSNLKLNGVKEYAIEKSKDNKNIIRIFKDDKYTYLGSKYSVDRDISKLLEELKDINNETIIIIFGLGAGEHILKVLNNTEYNKVIVFEPDISVINTFLNIDYVNEILDNKRFILSLYDKNKCKDIVNNVVSSIDGNNIKILSYANYNQIFSEEFNIFFRICIDAIERGLINLNTEICFSKKIIEVYLNNIKNIIHSIPVNLYKNKCKNIPAIIVSAGPSLSKNIHKLKDIQEEFIIICGARTLKPLLNQNIIPDYVCIIDPVDENCNFVKDCKQIDSSMVFCEISNFKTVNIFEGSKILFKEKSIFNDLSDEILQYNVDTLWSGGSVAHTCMVFANYLGCDTTIFMGQDLAFTNNKSHDDSVKFDFDKDVQNDKNNIYVEDIYGEKVLTNKVLNFYRKNFEDYINRFPNIKFINATEGGANIKGTKIMTLDEVIKKYSGSIKNKIIIEEEFKCFDENIIIDNLKSIKSELNKINKKSNKILKEIKLLESKGITVNTNSINILNNIKINNKKIEEVKILNSLMNPALSKVICNPKYRENNEDTDIERIKKIIEQTKIVYVTVVDSIKYLNPMLEKLIKELKEG